MVDKLSQSFILTRYKDIQPYRTKDGSLIRELMHPAVHGNRNLSVAEATVEPGAVEAIADRLDRWFQLPEQTRAEARATLVEEVARLWSWEGVARGVLAAAAGNLGGLPVPAP